MGCSFAADAVLQNQFHPNKRSKLKTINGKQNAEMIDSIVEKIDVVTEKLSIFQVQFAINKLSQHELFASLSQKELKSICQQMISAKSNKETYIFKQGDIGCCFFLIEKGKVTVQINGKTVRALEAGDTFGQLALLFRSGRTASIKCQAKENKFLIMKPRLYKQTLQKLKMEECSKNNQIIEKVPLFKILTNKQKYLLSTNIKICTYNQGSVIFNAGDDAQAIYIIAQGEVKIEIQGKQNIILKSPQIFGESSIKENEKRSGKATALTKLACSIISKKDIENCLGSNINSLIHYNIKKWSLMRSKIFSGFSDPDLNLFITAFDTVTAPNKKQISWEKHKGFIICLSGSINNQPVGTLFHENAWLQKSDSKESLIQTSIGQFAYLSFKKTTDLFASIEKKNKSGQSSLRTMYIINNELNLSEFSLIKKLGEGQFGQVFLIKNKRFGNSLFAVKCLNKEEINKEELMESVIQEKLILEKAIFPYIVGYLKAFHDAKHIYLLMEYIHGKEMFDVIREIKFMSQPMIKFYFATLLLSIQYLHSHNIVYRDLKPENSVIDHQGKVYLIDLGTAKELTTSTFFKTFTIIGTPHYMAPEIFEGKGYSFQIDYWSLGILLYQFACGYLPFGENTSGDPFAVYTEIKRGKLIFPKFVKDELLKNVIKFLLVKNPKERVDQVDFRKIKQMEFFHDLDWDALSNEQLAFPYIPKDFRGKQLQNYDKVEQKSFLRQFYKNAKPTEVWEWEDDVAI